VGAECCHHYENEHANRLLHGDLKYKELIKLSDATSIHLP
jgi:hypothetical protein